MCCVYLYGMCVCSVVYGWLPRHDFHVCLRRHPPFDNIQIGRNNALNERRCNIDNTLYFICHAKEERKRRQPKCARAI